MFLLTSIMAGFPGQITDMISSMGYGGIFILMIIESSGLPILPIPSELVMPFAGYLASTGNINWVLATIIGTIGSGIGSAIGYAIGAWGGKPLIDRYGRYIGATPDRMARAEMWFCKYGESSVFFTRMLPVVRTLVNVPAGMLKMNFYKFVAYSMAGVLPWCLALSYTGYTLGENWEMIGQYSQLAAYAAVIIAAVIICSFGLYALVRRGIAKKEAAEKHTGLLRKYDFIEGAEATLNTSP